MYSTFLSLLVCFFLPTFAYSKLPSIPLHTSGFRSSLVYSCLSCLSTFCLSFPSFIIAYIYLLFTCACRRAFPFFFSLCQCVSTSHLFNFSLLSYFFLSFVFAPFFLISFHFLSFFFGNYIVLFFFHLFFHSRTCSLILSFLIFFFFHSFFSQSFFFHSYLAFFHSCLNFCSFSIRYFLVFVSLMEISSFPSTFH